MTLRIVAISLVAISGMGALRAQQYVPSWWLDAANPVIAPSTQSPNFGVANAGQLKWIATRAKAHLDVTLLGGAGTAVNTVVAGFSSTNNYAPINLAQLKFVAKPFYDRLKDPAIGYNTKLNLRANGYPPAWNEDYPWASGTAISANYKPVTIGQLKLVFSFDIVDSNQNGTLDYLEGIYPAASSTRDTDGDGVPDTSDAYPNDPTKTVVLVNDPSDHIGPTIAILKPTGVSLLP